MTFPSATAGIRQRSARLGRYLTLLCGCLLLLLVLERFSSIAVQLGTGGAGAGAFGRLAVQTIGAVPELFYLLALWWIRQALAAIAQGELYGPTIRRMLERVGIMLAVGAFADVFLVPGTSRLLGFNPGYWIAFDVAAFVLAAIGLSLKVIADLLRHAAALQAELDGIF